MSRYYLVDCLNFIFPSFVPPIPSERTATTSSSGNLPSRRLSTRANNITASLSFFIYFTSVIKMFISVPSGARTLNPDANIFGSNPSFHNANPDLIPYCIICFFIHHSHLRYNVTLDLMLYKLLGCIIPTTH